MQETSTWKKEADEFLMLMTFISIFCAFRQSFSLPEKKFYGFFLRERIALPKRHF